METWTILLALVFFGITASMVFIFVSSARLYMTSDDETAENPPHTRSGRRTVARQGDRRRNSAEVEFPLRIGHVVIEYDRRKTTDRRHSSLH